MCVGHRRRRGIDLGLVIERIVQHRCEAHARLFDLGGGDSARLGIIAIRQRYWRSVLVAAGRRAERVAADFASVKDSRAQSRGDPVLQVEICAAVIRPRSVTASVRASGAISPTTTVSQ